MDANDVLSLGLGVTPPWKLVGQRLDTDKRPNELDIEAAADRRAKFPCPDCGRLCKAHDFGEFTWRLAAMGSMVPGMKRPAGAIASIFGFTAP